MRKIQTLVGIAALAVSAGVFAQSNPPREPLVRAFEAVTENLVEHPGNPGLPKAQARIVENKARHETRADRIERVERPERPERVERVDLPTRAEIARAQRPERPERGLAKGHK